VSSSIPPEGGPSPAYSNDELLPPVEPPSAGFIIQLFVIPAVIVAAVVLLWLLVESLARGGEQNPDEILKGLRSSNQARFQRAKDLADMLRQPERYPKLKTSSELSQKLGVYLDELVEAGSDAESEVSMRYFLCSALGEFRVADGLPALVNAAQNDPERDVRRKAINAIAVLAGSLEALKPPQTIESEELVEALLQLADDQDELIRSETAFAIGVLAAQPKADPRLAATLQELADDTYTDARFNAAIGLANLGHARAATAVAEMLDPASIEASLRGEQAMTEQVTAEDLRKQKAYKRNMILHNAVKAANRLAANSSISSADRATVAAALAKFIELAPTIEEPAPVPSELVDAMKETQAKLAQGAPQE
jgi:HEAT repeat protein